MTKRQYAWVPEHSGRGCTCEYHYWQRIAKREHMRRKRGAATVTERREPSWGCRCGRRLSEHSDSEIVGGCREMVR